MLFRSRDYHHRARVKLPNARLHTAIHVIVENQAAMGDELPVRRTDERLQTEGLDRHEAIHAVGSVLAAHIHEILNTGSPNADANALYWAALETLTAEGWRCGP